MKPYWRCFICGARDWRDDPGAVRCSHCGLRIIDSGIDPLAAASDLRARLVSGAFDLGAAPPAEWNADLYTMRIAAAACGRSVRPADARQAEALAAPHRTLPAAGASPKLAEPAEIAVGLIARPGEAARVEELVATLDLPFVSEAIVVFDCKDPPPPVRGARVLSAPLGGDFATQRNRIQAQARSPWVLQLDTDERLEGEALDLLGRLAFAVGEQGIVSIGLPRINLIDGVRSDLYPDIQYRLNRREVRYAGAVHERPDLDGKWWLSTL